MTEQSVESTDHDDTYVIVYPVSRTFETKVEDLHSTILYLGELDVSPAELVGYLDMFHTEPNKEAEVAGLDWFGPDHDVPVLRLEPDSYLTSNNIEVELLLAQYGIHSDSEFGYSPHVTIDQETVDRGNLPTSVILNKAQLWRGDTRYPLISGRAWR